MFETYVLTPVLQVRLLTYFRNIQISKQKTDKKTQAKNKKNPSKPQKRENVFSQEELAQDSIDLLNWIVLFNNNFTQALTGFSSNYSEMSWTACMPPKKREIVPQDFVINAEEVITQKKWPSLGLR